MKLQAGCTKGWYDVAKGKPWITHSKAWWKWFVLVPTLFLCIILDVILMPISYLED